MKKGVLLINLGTPDSPSTKDVRKYLTQFLNDPRVIDISPLSRWLLVNLLIVPFRSPKSAALYKKIWTKEGSPLVIHGRKLKQDLQQALGNDYVVELGMRYQHPSLESALNELKKKQVSEICVIPLYPQYASSSTGSSLDELFRLLQQWEVVPGLKIIKSFYKEPLFIEAFAEVGEKYDPASYDHVLFSYHGLPERQILKASSHYGNNYCKLGSCCESNTTSNQYCYRANCFETTRLLAAKLGIPKEKYTISFQSRLGRDPWIKPYSDHVIADLAKKGMKKLLVFSPAFVADCLETLYEIGTEYDELFKTHGGEKIQLVESLNTQPLWLKCLEGFVKG